MRISKTKTVCRIALFLAFFFLINAALGFFLEPFQGSSAEMWDHYREKKHLDMVYVGSSQCISGLKPDTIDAVLGTKSYNMGTNMQSFHNSGLAIRSAVREKGVKRIVFVIDYEMLDCKRNKNFRAEASFQHARGTGLSPAGRIRNDLSFITDPEYFGRASSVNYLLPWIYDRDMDIRMNVREKMAGRVLNEDTHRDENGFLPSDEVLSSGINYITLATAPAWQKEATTLIELKLTRDNRRELLSIIRFCKRNKIELYGITVPYPNFLTIYSEKSYAAAYRELKTLFNDNGFTYYDFNLASASLYQSDVSDYADNGHMNTKGATAFSSMYAAFLQSKTDHDRQFENFD